MTHLISCGHYSHHREFLNLHFCDTDCGQEPDFRGAHVGALRQHTLSTLNIMTNRPGAGQRTGVTVVEWNPV